MKNTEVGANGVHENSIIYINDNVYKILLMNICCKKMEKNATII